MRKALVTAGVILVACGAAFLVFTMYDGPTDREEPSETRKLRDRLAWRLREGDDRLQRGDVEGALEAHRDCLAIAMRGAELNPTNPTWQRDQAVIHFRLSFDQKEAGSLSEAREHAQSCVEIYREISQKNPQWRDELPKMEAHLAQLEQADG